MILHAKERQILVTHAFVGMVVQVEVRHFDIARWQRFRIHAESVILRGDFDLIGQQILHRVIRAVVPEFQFESLAAER